MATIAKFLQIPYEFLKESNMTNQQLNAKLGVSSRVAATSQRKNIENIQSFWAQSRSYRYWVAHKSENYQLQIKYIQRNRSIPFIVVFIRKKFVRADNSLPLTKDLAESQSRLCQFYRPLCRFPLQTTLLICPTQHW